MKKREGFPGQILHVIPRPLFKEMAHHVLLHQLAATDIGWYPQAKHHYFERPAGAPENILILCVDGAGWAEIEGKRVEVSRHQALLIPRETAHRYGADEQAPWSIHWVHLIGPVAEYFVHLLPDEVFLMSVAAETVTATESLFQECYWAFVGSFAWQRMVYVTQTLHHLLGRLFFNNPAFSPVLRSSQARNLDKTLEYMSRNLHKSLRLEDLATYANMSKSHFSRSFKEQTGFSPIDYFINLKVQHAAMLLRFTDKTVREIGAAVGHKDPYYFSRIFKKVVGVAPTAFRQQPQ